MAQFPWGWLTPSVRLAQNVRASGVSISEYTYDNNFQYMAFVENEKNKQIEMTMLSVNQMEIQKGDSRNERENPVKKASNGLLSRTIYPTVRPLDAKYSKQTTAIDIINERKIEYFVHFTRATNLQSILRHGLVPVANQGRKEIVCVRNDLDRFDHMLHCTSCSVMFPNYKYLFSDR